MAPTRTQAVRGGGPKAGRPAIRDYGIPKGRAGLLDWARVSERLRDSKFYWISTVGPNSRPHATPVDGLWLDETLYFGGSPGTRRNRNLAANPHACVHLESGLEVVILHGEAREQPPLDAALTGRLADAHGSKYGYGFTAEHFMGGGPELYIFRPRVAFAWTQFPKDATRWSFEP